MLTELVTTQVFRETIEKNYPQIKWTFQVIGAYLALASFAMQWKPFQNCKKWPEIDKIMQDFNAEKDRKIIPFIIPGMTGKYILCSDILCHYV